MLLTADYFRVRLSKRTGSLQVQRAIELLEFALSLLGTRLLLPVTSTTNSMHILYQQMMVSARTQILISFGTICLKLDYHLLTVVVAYILSELHIYSMHTGQDPAYRLEHGAAMMMSTAFQLLLFFLTHRFVSVATMEKETLENDNLILSPKATFISPMKSSTELAQPNLRHTQPQRPIDYNCSESFPSEASFSISDLPFSTQFFESF